MELEKFISRNFKPREDIENRAKKLIKEELKKLPIEGILRATIVDEGESFSISIVAKAQSKIFSSESHHRKEKMVGSIRHWQLSSLKILLHDIIHQIKSSLKIT